MSCAGPRGPRAGRGPRWLRAGLALALCLGAAGDALAGADPACSAHVSAAVPDFVPAVARNTAALVHLLTVPSAALTDADQVEKAERRAAACGGMR